MSDSNPVTGRPFGGRDRKDESAGLPGERPEEETVGPPQDSGRDDESASRAATEGAMDSPSGPSDGPQPTEGVPGQVDAPSPADATEGQPPGGSAANQTGRTPDR